MRAAGIRRYSGPVELLELPGPGELRADEVLVEVRFGREEILRPGFMELFREAEQRVREAGLNASGIDPRRLRRAAFPAPAFA